MVKRALVRRPSPRLADGLVTHVERQPVDVALAMRQWQSYVDALSACGWTPVEVPPADDHPDSVFVEDTVVVYGDVAVVTRPGAVERRGEEEAVVFALRDAGHRVVRMTEPGTLDGGDVLVVGSTMYVGQGGRSNGPGLAQLAAAVEPLGAQVRPVQVSTVLHLKSAVTALPDGTIVGFEPLVEAVDAFERFLAVPEPSGSHVVLLGGDRLLMAADAPKSAALFASMGYQPVCVDIGEFEKLEGCVTCLSVLLDR